jgi:sec-independent protein translocase protein TatA
MLAWVPGYGELIIILLVVLLVFGKRLPEIARGMGRSLTEFKKGINEGNVDTDDVADDAVKAKSDAADGAKDASGAQGSKKTS